jgi:hypothetical protein
LIFFKKKLPTELELIKKYNLYSDGKFPKDKEYPCCGKIVYVMDMLTHMIWYHKKSMRVALKLLDEHFKNPVFEK